MSVIGKAVDADAVIDDWRVMGSAEALPRIALLEGRMIEAGMDGETAWELAHRWYSSDTVMGHVLLMCDERIARRKRRCRAKRSGRQ